MRFELIRLLLERDRVWLLLGAGAAARDQGDQHGGTAPAPLQQRNIMEVQP